MLNTNPLNSVLLWGWPAPASVGEQGNFVFNWYSLNDCLNRRVTASNHDDIGRISFKTYDSPRVDWGWVLGHYYRRKDIRIRISLTATTAELLNDEIDSFKYEMSEVEGDLEITINDEVRIVKASITKLSFNRKYFHLTFVQDVEIVFSTMEPHFYAKTEESLTYYGITADLNEEILYSGKVKTEPKFYVIFWPTVTGLNTITVTTGGDTISIAETSSSGDILIIDCEDKEVLLNDVSIDYTGVFLELQVGANPISFNFTWGSTFFCDITEINKRKYL